MPKLSLLSLAVKIARTLARVSTVPIAVATVRALTMIMVTALEMVPPMAIMVLPVVIMVPAVAMVPLAPMVSLTIPMTVVTVTPTELAVAMATVTATALTMTMTTVSKPVRVAKAADLTTMQAVPNAVLILANSTTAPSAAATTVAMMGVHLMSGWYPAVGFVSLLVSFLI